MPGLQLSVHKNLCTDGKRNEASHFGVRLGGERTLRRTMKQRKIH